MELRIESFANILTMYEHLEDTENSLYEVFPVYFQKDLCLPWREKNWMVWVVFVCNRTNKNFIESHLLG